MERIQNNLSLFLTPVNGAKDKRADLVSQFVKILNNERIVNKYKPLKDSFYAIKMSHMSFDDMMYFFSMCKHSKSFSKTWWGALKVK